MTEADIPAPVLFYLAAVIAFKIRVDVRALRQTEVRPRPYSIQVPPKSSSDAFLETAP